jgi:hypothetical protein
MKVIHIPISIIVYAIDGVCPVIGNVIYQVRMIKPHIGIDDGPDIVGVSLGAVPGG